MFLLYSCYQIYLHFPTTDDEEANNDDVVMLVISNEEAEANVAESIRKYEEFNGQHDPLSPSYTTFTSSATRHTTPGYSLSWVWRHLKEYFDLRPLRNLLIRAGLYSAPGAGDTSKSHSGDKREGGIVGDEAEGPYPGVYHLDTNMHLSEQQKKNLIAHETDSIAKRLEER